MKRVWSYLLVLGMIGCGPEGDSPDELEVEDGITLLSPRKQLIRASIDLRGIHPSEADLAHVEVYPDSYSDFVEQYLYDERFAGRMEEVFNEVFLTRSGETFFQLEEAGMGGLSDDVVADSIGDEPLKLVSHIVEHDLPYSDVVTASYSMADPLVAQMWDMEYTDGDVGWHESRYSDGRPQVGVLSSTTLWSRYPSAGVNGNRHRANTLSRIFLCDDYLSRPVSFSRSQIDALTSGDPEEVIADNDVCQSCHSTLDPLAGHFFGFWWEVEGDTLEDQTLYRAEDEEMWKDISGKSPGFYGIPTANLQELGWRLAEDARFVDCAVETVFQGLTQRLVEDADWGEIAAHRKVFNDRGLVIRDLVRSIVTSRTYLAAEVEDADLADRVNTLKMVSPGQLEGIVHAKTGYRWSFAGRAALSRNASGLAVLSGGIDSRDVTERNTSASVGALFVQERLAQAAGWHVAVSDLDPERESPPKLLKYVTIEDRPETNPAAFEKQIRSLYRSITGLPLEESAESDEGAEPPPEVEALIQLWKNLYSVEASPVRAWAGVVSVVLRDPTVLFY